MSSKTIGYPQLMDSSSSWAIWPNSAGGIKNEDLLILVNPPPMFAEGLAFSYGLRSIIRRVIINILPLFLLSCKIILELQVK
jgi:hypothetical protein